VGGHQGLVESTAGSGRNGGEGGGKAVPALEYILDNKGKKEVYYFKDLGPHCKDAYVQRQLREIYQ
jgi:hypothetical protein